MAHDELKYQKQVEYKMRLEQIDKLLFHDAKALGYNNISDVLMCVDYIPEDFFQHIKMLMTEETEIHEALEQLELPPNVVVFPLSRRSKYDKFSPFDGDGGPMGPRAA